MDINKILCDFHLVGFNALEKQIYNTEYQVTGTNICIALCIMQFPMYMLSQGYLQLLIIPCSELHSCTATTGSIVYLTNL